MKKRFLEYLLEGKSAVHESFESDQYERDVASQLQSYSDENGLGWEAERPKVGTNYSDVRVVTPDKDVVWIEVKMNVTDQLGTPRVFYKDGKWQSNMHTPIAKDICELLQVSDQANQFIEDLAAFTGLDPLKLYLSPKKSEIMAGSIEGMVTLEQLNEYAESHGRYIMKQDYNHLEKVLAKHYLEGKAEPAQYIQIGDNFFQLDDAVNPLGFTDVPTIAGDGILNVRFTTRAQFYEIQAEIKFDKRLRPSPVSFKPGSSKPQPELYTASQTPNAADML